jgi:hypothetical protein
MVAVSIIIIFPDRDIISLFDPMQSLYSRSVNFLAIDRQIRQSFPVRESSSDAHLHCGDFPDIQRGDSYSGLARLTAGSRRTPLDLVDTQKNDNLPLGSQGGIGHPSLYERA